MFKEIAKSLVWSGKTLKLSTGKIARQADGSVLVEMGDSVVLCTAVFAKQEKEGIDFFPLTVNYREMAYSAGKIPGGFFKREGKASEKETLVARLIDRPIRPLFHPNFRNETQVVCTVVSHDPEAPTDILAIIGASAALAISGAPYMHVVGASKVGIIDGEFVLNPSFETLKNSKLDLVVAGTKDSVMMVESEAKVLSEEQMLDAVKFGHNAFVPVIQLIEDFAKEARKDMHQVQVFDASALTQLLKQNYTQKIKDAFAIKSKHDRSIAIDQLIKDAIESTIQHNADYTADQVKSAIKAIESEILRQELLGKQIRIDGRKPDEIRQIVCETSLLPRTHGSSLFTRGETQALVVTTLGSSSDEQMIDGLDGEYKEHFMLNYIFPPYSVGEALPMRAPGRREIGHGKLAWRAINPFIPSKAEFPYTIRVVSEITESNGSSSMATVCGTSMALMDAGVPLASPVAGIAMGLIKEQDSFVVLSDIMADEDHLGDMDFKVAGSKDGITALQMDIKVTGITFEIMQRSLEQAKAGRMHILEKMSLAISTNKAVSQNAPSTESFKINKDKIREVIGPGGKVIREICESTGAKIDITDEGVVSIFASSKDNLDQAVSRVKSIACDPEVGEIFEAKVVKLIESGAFVNLGGRDGFLHISEIADERVNAVSDVLSEGQVVKLRVIGFDHKGRTKLSMKNLDTPLPIQDISASERNTQNKPHKDDRDRSRNKPEKGFRDNKKERNSTGGREERSTSNSPEGSGRSRKYFN